MRLALRGREPRGIQARGLVGQEFELPINDEGNRRKHFGGTKEAGVLGRGGGDQLARNLFASSVGGTVAPIKGVQGLMPQDVVREFGNRRTAHRYGVPGCIVLAANVAMDDGFAILYGQDGNGRKDIPSQRREHVPEAPVSPDRAHGKRGTRQEEGQKGDNPAFHGLIVAQPNRPLPDIWPTLARQEAPCLA